MEKNWTFNSMQVIAIFKGYPYNKRTCETTDMVCTL